MASVISNRWGCCGIEFCFRAEPEPNPEVLFTFDVRELYHVFGRQDPYQHQVENIPCFHVSRNVLLDPFLVRDQVDCVLSDVPCFVEPFIFEVMRDRLSTFCLQIAEHYHGHIPEGVRFHTVVVMHYRAGELRGRLVLMPSDPEPVEIIDADSEYYEDEGEIETERGFGGVSASEVAIANLERVSSAAARAQVESCSICFDEFEETQGDHSDLARLPCSHIFHYHCIAQWLERSRTCPLCRYEM